MLRVMLASSNQFFFMSQVSTYSVANGKKFPEGFLIGPLGIKPSVAMEYQGHIHSGPLNRFDERECDHTQWEGDVVILGGLQWQTHPDFIVPFVTIGGSKFCAIIQAGEEYLSPQWLDDLGRTYQVRAVATPTGGFSVTYRGGTKLATVSTGYTFNASQTQYRYSSPTLPDRSYAAFLAWSFQPTTGTWRTLPRFTPTAPVLTRETLHSRLTFVRQECFMPILDGYKTPPHYWGKLAQLTVNNISFADTNGLQYFPELLTFKALFKELTKVNIRSPKALAGAYLAWKYGVESSYRDTKLYAKGVTRFLQARMGDTPPWRAARGALFDTFDGVRGPVRDEYHYKIFYRHYDDAILEGYRVLREWGLAPTLTAAWDAIPLSFVVDWFTDVGNVIETIDAKPLMAMYRILGVTKSRKLSVTTAIPELYPEGVVVGNIKYSVYTRRTQKKADEPRFAFDSPQDFDNHVEATALIIQRMKFK